MTTTPQGGAPAPATTNIMQALQQTAPTQLASLPVLEERFIKLYSLVQGVDMREAEMVFHAEKFHFQKAISENEGLRACETLSLYGCFMDAAVQGLSFDPKKKLAYLIPGKVNVGTRDEKRYVNRATLEISPYGELAIRQQKGQIKYADNPVIVYEGDTFEPYQNEEGRGVVYKLNAAHGTKIVAAFLRIVRMDGSVDYHWLLQGDWMRLKGYSEKKNFGKANALYSSFNGDIDPGFLGAKLIKHAFKSYPKVKLAGAFSQLQPEETEETRPELSAAQMYGFEPGTATRALPAEQPLELPIKKQEPQPQALSMEAQAAILQSQAPAHDAQPTPAIRFSEDDGSGF